MSRYNSIALACILIASFNARAASNDSVGVCTLAADGKVAYQRSITQPNQCEKRMAIDLLEHGARHVTMSICDRKKTNCYTEEYDITATNERSLWDAMTYGLSTDTIRHLVEEGADVNGILQGIPGVVNATGETPLLHAAELGRGDLVEFLISAGADVNARAFKKQNTIIMNLIKNRSNIEMITLLLKGKANPNLKNVDGNTAFHSLVKNTSLTDEDYMRIANELQSAGGDPNIKNDASMIGSYRGDAPIHLAARLGRLEALHALVELKGINLDALDSIGLTALDHLSSICDLPEQGPTPELARKIKLLVNAGASVKPHVWYPEYNQRFSAYDSAKKCGYDRETLELLKP